MEQAPARVQQHQSAGHAHDRQRDAEERQHVRADEHRRDEQQKRVAGDDGGEAMAAAGGKVRRHGEKDRRHAERVHDGHERRQHDENRFQGVGRHAVLDYRVMEATAHTRRGWQIALYALLCVIWGSTWLVIKVGYGGLGPFNVASLRFFMAGAVLALMMPLLRARWPQGRVEWALVAWIGLVLFAGDYGLIYWAEQWLERDRKSVV